MKAGEKFQQTEWTVEEDVKCKKMVSSAGGQLCGFDFTHRELVHWASISGEGN